MTRSGAVLHRSLTSDAKNHILFTYGPCTLVTLDLAMALARGSVGPSEHTDHTVEREGIKKAVSYGQCRAQQACLV